MRSRISAKIRIGRTPLFNLCGGHPALDLVNSLDYRFSDRERLDLLTSYDDLLRFVEQTQLLDGRQIRELAKAADPAIAARILRSAKELREAIAGIFYAYVDDRAPTADQIRILEKNLGYANRRRELRWTKPMRGERAGLKWSWGSSEREPELPLWVLAQSAARLLMSDTMDRVHACAHESCRWLFVDTSKNGTRRWCQMRLCGNRMKARRFQARRASES